jgi:hypothetical protein
MANTTIASRRLAAQRLTGDRFATPAEVVSWLGAVQAQDYPGARWSLGLRMRDATDGALDAAVDAGTILRTHVMRPTWHFVSPADIRWLQALTSPRVHAANASMYRRFELDDELFARSNAIIVRALESASYLTRDELQSALAQGGIAADGVRLLYIFMHAELDALICSGPRRGKQSTYALLDRRAPDARVMRRDEALAELTRRYIAGHGPATARDFARWSGLSVAGAREGLQMAAAHLAYEEIGGQTYWFATDASDPAELPAASDPSSSAYLLPTYDEFLVGFANFDTARRGGQERDENRMFTATFLIDDTTAEIAGNWRRTFRGRSVVLELMPFAPLGAARRAAFLAAARRYGVFAGMPVDVVWL